MTTKQVENKIKRINKAIDKVVDQRLCSGTDLAKLLKQKVELEREHERLMAIDSITRQKKDLTKVD